MSGHGHGGGTEGEPIAVILGEAFFVPIILFLFLAAIPDLFSVGSGGGHHH